MAGTAAAALAQAYATNVPVTLGGLHGAVPPLLLTVLTSVALFGVCGLAAARVLLPPALAAYEWVLVLPIGAACLTLSLTLLGLLGVPFGVSLPVVLVGFAAAALASLRGAPAAAVPRDAPPALLRTALPLVLAFLIGFVAVIPVVRTGFLTVIGQNGDAVLAVGTAELLKQAPPETIDPALALDRVPLQWRSKLPIYYGLAAVSAVSGQDAIEAFPGVSGTLLALAALGFFVLAAVLLRAPPLVALLVLAAVPLQRMLVHVTIHPYYNQLWGIFTLPFIFVFGWLYLREPSRRSFALLALFVTLGLFAYPLMLPFPMLFLGTVAVLTRRRRHAAGEPVGWVSVLRLPRLRWWAWVVVAVFAVPVVLVLVRGVFEKMLGAAEVLLPGTDLSGWSGPALDYLPFGRFFGVDLPAAAAVPLTVVVFAAAVLGLRRAHRDAALAVAVTTVMALLVALYFWARGQGQLFYFKDLGFLGPIVVTAAVVGLGAALLHAARPARAGAALVLVALAVIFAGGAHRELDATYEYATRDLLELREWDRELPAGASVRIDIAPSGYQLWSWYLMPSRPLSTREPLGGFFPHPPQGEHADLVLADALKPRPGDVTGPPVRANRSYALYRQAPGVPGADRSSRALVFEVTQIGGE